MGFDRFLHVRVALFLRAHSWAILFFLVGLALIGIPASWARKNGLSKKGVLPIVLFWDAHEVLFFSWSLRPSCAHCVFFLKRPLRTKNRHGQVTHIVFPLNRKVICPSCFWYIFLNKIQIFGKVPSVECWPIVFIFYFPAHELRKKIMGCAPIGAHAFFFYPMILVSLVAPTSAHDAYIIFLFHAIILLDVLATGFLLFAHHCSFFGVRWLTLAARILFLACKCSLIVCFTLLATRSLLPDCCSFIADCCCVLAPS